MKYYVIAGEASGDLHGSNLLKQLSRLDPQAQFRCWGGDMMNAQGAELVKHYRELAFMGFAEVLMNLRTILRNIDFCREDIRRWKPDAVILIDYPGFNLRIAGFAKSLGIKVFYYISPQVWAWKESRVQKIKQVVDHLFVILPFEKPFYDKHQYHVDFVGHPLLDAIGEFDAETGLSRDERKIIALLPGSRRQEIGTMLPIMLDAAEKFPGYRFVIAGAPSVPASYYQSVTGDRPVEIIAGKTYALLRNAYAALVTSGTATLETALFGVPEVVCYKGGAISYQIAKRLVKVKYISLVNLVMDKEVVKELIQYELTTENLANELRKITEDENYRNQLLSDYDVLKQKLGGSGASEKTAGLILQYLGKK
ncbi:MAG: lipid-A-disaccharide synthase [Bacteroidetes bacterium]|nr:MAG: lipid-A-disaccharide synthase [Bacteroidota bacterium]